ncbi:MAG: potassium channel protein [Acidimicrobiales bacterium]|nr:potassium channel protein [Acidimicrobiales bacterium]
MSFEEHTNRIQRGVGLLAAVTIVSSVGYMVLGLAPLDAVYQTVITVSTVGYREVGVDDESQAYRLFTIFVIMGGVGTAFYTLGVLLETLVEGRLTDQLWRRRMERTIAAMSGHVIVCGWGRVGRTIANDIAAAGKDVVVIDIDPDRLHDLDLPFVTGDATDDAVLSAASIERASALVAALDTDAANLFVTLSGRSARSDLFIVARARVESAEPKLAQAGADRVVNPQYIGGERIAAMILQPSVADFLDVVMHDGSLEFRLAEVQVPAGSPIAEESLRDAHLRDRTGALVLAMRDDAGNFRTNPPPDTPINAGEILIAIGTVAQLQALRDEVGVPRLTG